MREDPNEAVLGLLRDQGDALTEAREIDHYSYFPTPMLRAQFIDKCIEAGFRLRGTVEPSRPGSGFGAVVFHKDVPGEEMLEQITELLRAFADDCEGDYDGWETQIVA